MVERADQIKEVSELYFQVLQELNQQSVPRWLELDLTFQQMKVLYLLKQSGPLKMSDLSRMLGVSMPTITGIISRLVERGENQPLVTRATSLQDRRQVWAHLTEEGRTITEYLDSMNREALEKSLAHLTDNQLEAASHSLANLVAAVKGVPPQAATVSITTEPSTIILKEIVNGNSVSSRVNDPQPTFS
jgi:DNA-binding MarR family transcriptional regulator